MKRLTQQDKINALVKAFSDCEITITMQKDGKFKSKSDCIIWRKEGDKEWNDVYGTGHTVGKSLTNMFDLLTKPAADGKRIEVIVPHVGFSEEFKWDKRKKDFIITHDR